MHEDLCFILSVVLLITEVSILYLFWFLPLIQCLLWCNRVNVVSPARGAMLELRVCRDLVVSPEHLEVMDPRYVDDLHTGFIL